MIFSIILDFYSLFLFLSFMGSIENIMPTQKDDKTFHFWQKDYKSCRNTMTAEVYNI